MGPNRTGKPYWTIQDLRMSFAAWIPKGNEPERSGMRVGRASRVSVNLLRVGMTPCAQARNSAPLDIILVSDD